ncbi:hypothetical protein NHX12_027052 [Muraenolepis orangiensis]|uniref:Uncharacterized protein n=1 Tax=Muraenolepis orangiensis TaxID=630683 RepID=A0A9Q0EDW7_9TELE|nr:hypothetical protein NHX12_027052 [Muraenolepis orangiensis]
MFWGGGKAVPHEVVRRFQTPGKAKLFGVFSPHDRQDASHFGKHCEHTVHHHAGHCGHSSTDGSEPFPGINDVCRGQQSCVRPDRTGLNRTHREERSRERRGAERGEEQREERSRERRGAERGEEQRERRGAEREEQREERSR